MKQLRYAVFGAFLCAATAAAEPPGRAGVTAEVPFERGMIERLPGASEPGTPPAEAVSPAAAPAPVEVPGTTPGGGWKVSGPFLHTMRATTGADGRVTARCAPGRPGE